MVTTTKKIASLGVECSREHLLNLQSTVEEAWRRHQRLRMAGWSNRSGIDFLCCMNNMLAAVSS